MCWNLLSSGLKTSNYLYAGDIVDPGKLFQYLFHWSVVFFQWLHYLFHHAPKQFECRGLKMLWILRFIWDWSHPASSSWAYQWSCRIRYYPWEIWRKTVYFLCFSILWFFFLSLLSISMPSYWLWQCTFIIQCKAHCHSWNWIQTWVCTEATRNGRHWARLSYIWPSGRNHHLGGWKNFHCDKTWNSFFPQAIHGIWIESEDTRVVVSWINLPWYGVLNVILKNGKKFIVEKDTSW